MEYWLTYLLAFSLTAALIWLLRPVATHIGLLDCPSGRKCHDGRVPLIGGVAMFLGFLIALLTLPGSLDAYRGLVAAGTILVLVGVLDDMHELSVRFRFGAQIAAALLMVYWGGVAVRDLGELAGNSLVTLGILTVPFTVFATVGVINSFNMADGVDGLAGGVALIAFGVMGILAADAGRWADAQVLMVLMCAAGGFLCFNFRFPGRRQALVFMGDAGSMFLGFALTWFAISLSQGPNPAMSPVTALWILALPLLDTVSIMLRRMIMGRSPFAPDREHFHHVFQVAGFSVFGTVSIVLSVCLLLALLGVGGLYAGIPEYWMFGAFLLLFAGYFWGMKHAWKVMKALRQAAA